MDERHLPDWNENALSLGKPAAMDTPTLIEWIERQLETKQDTEYRHLMMHRMHQKWHETHPGIWTCCINVGGLPNMLLTVNERRDLHTFKERWEKSCKDGKPIYLEEGMKITPLPER